VIVPGTGHFPMMEDPAAFNRILREVIEGFGG
jgi:pimeloyl-ACP methyl ester carboxylesterase